MQTLESFVAGRWAAGSGDRVVLDNPSTEEPLAEVARGGLDLGEAVAWGRDVGGAALRAMTLVERAGMLGALSKALREHREELLDLSQQNGGNTRGDAKFDVDGAIGTLAAYGAWGKACGERGWLVDGEGVQLGRTPRFWGEHLRVPKVGLAVHVNAFNFPAWGMGEKMACALLAGVPVLEKAGTASAVLAWRLAQLVVGSGVLPEGAFQFLAGSVGDLLDHLGPQDVVAFTGSADTGRKVRGNANLIAHNVRVNIEADSINAAILGPDVGDEDEVWNEFLGNVVVDMTQKAGQKCTAVRRVLVPADRADAVAEELAARLADIRVGDVADGQVRMGPVASRAQLADVRAGIAGLQAAADVVCGGPAPIADKGWFVAPTLLRARDPEAAVLHEREVFGPCATVVPYEGGAAEAVRLTNRGGGSLVASLYSNDRGFVTEVVTGIAPWHGRVWIGSEKSAGQTLGPGAVLPASVHGGPGRAGGGEELGGLRGLEPYTQRVARQGDKGRVSRFTSGE
ncbi:MAG: 3,4-dehydroadipyl-CoA semialdehyde dehydrogenase [Planctomycetota bacterium]